MCLFVGLSAFYRPHDICPLCGAGSEWPRAAKPSRPGRPRASGQAHAQREHARMPYNFSTKKSYADAFQKQNRTRARMLSYYSLPSLGVFTFRFVLNRTSSLVGADLGQLVHCICTGNPEYRMHLAEGWNLHRYSLERTRFFPAVQCHAVVLKMGWKRKSWESFRYSTDRDSCHNVLQTDAELY